MAIKQILATAAVFVLSSPLLVSQASRSPYAVTAVRHSSEAGLTTVAIGVSAKADFRTARLHNPERFYVDILNAQPSVGRGAASSEEVRDPMVNRIRIAAFDPLTTRVVLDLASPGALTSVTRRESPDRVVIEVRGVPGRATSAPRPPAPPAPLPPSKVEERSTPVVSAGFLGRRDVQTVAYRSPAQPPVDHAADPPPPPPPPAPAVSQDLIAENAPPPQDTAAPPSADPASSGSRAAEEGLFEVDLFGYASFYRSIQSGIGTKFANGGGGGMGLVENLYSHWGLEESFSYSANNLGILYPVTTGVPTGFGVREYSFALNDIFYFTGRHNRVRPFVTAGAGGASFHPTSAAVHQAQTIPNAFGSAVNLGSDTKFQFNYGGGVRWRVSKHVGLLIEARGLLSKNPGFGVSCCGCTLIPSCRSLSGLELIAGVTFHWGARESPVPVPPVVVVPIPPPPRFVPGTIHGAASVCVGSPVVLSSDASDSGGSALTYRWTVDGQPAGGNTREWTFTPDRPGEYQVQLEVTGSDLGAKASSQLSFSVHALDCAPKPVLPCCSLEVACSAVVGELAAGGTAPLHVTTIGPAGDQVRYNWSSTEGRILNPNSADAVFDSTGVSFPASYQTQTKIVTVMVSVTGEQNISKSCQAQITVRKEPQAVHYDVVFAPKRSRVNNCAKRFLIERLYPELGRSYRGYTVYLIGHRGPGETGPLDRERVLNVAAVLAAGKGVCGKLDPLRIKVGWVGVRETPYVDTPCALSTESPVAERKADQIDYADPHVKDRRVEIWLVPEGQTLPMALPVVQSLTRDEIDRLGCPK